MNPLSYLPLEVSAELAKLRTDGLAVDEEEDCGIDKQCWQPGWMRLAVLPRVERDKAAAEVPAEANGRLSMLLSWLLKQD